MFFRCPLVCVHGAERSLLAACVVLVLHLSDGCVPHSLFALLNALSWFALSCLPLGHAGRPSLRFRYCIAVSLVNLFGTRCSRAFLPTMFSASLAPRLGHPPPPVLPAIPGCSQPSAFPPLCSSICAFPSCPASSLCRPARAAALLVTVRQPSPRPTVSVFTSSISPARGS